MSFGSPSVAPAPAPAPKPLPAAPTAADTATAQIIETQKQKRRKGYQSTILTGALGSTSYDASQAPTSKKRLLGE